MIIWQDNETKSIYGYEPDVTDAHNGILIIAQTGRPSSRYLYTEDEETRPEDVAAWYGVEYQAGWKPPTIATGDVLEQALQMAGRALEKKPATAEDLELNARLKAVRDQMMGISK